MGMFEVAKDGLMRDWREALGEGAKGNYVGRFYAAFPPPATATTSATAGAKIQQNRLIASSTVLPFSISPTMTLSAQLRDF